MINKNISRNLFSILLLSISLLYSSVASSDFNPCLELTKEVSADGGITWNDANTEAEAVSVSSGAMYRFTITACSGYNYHLINTSVSDDILQVYHSLPDLFVWSGGESQSFVVEAPDICTKYGGGTLLNTASASSTGTVIYTSSYPVWADDVYLTDDDSAWIRCDAISGGEGCTPGYWKQTHHYDSWPETVTPSTAFSSVFGRVITINTKSGLITDPTFAEALSAKGGKVNTVARHSAAAYLNAVANSVSYDISAEEVIEALQQSVDSNDFGTLIEGLVNLNEQSCPLN